MTEKKDFETPDQDASTFLLQFFKFFARVEVALLELFRRLW